jgi:virginiamycin B lyase
VSAVPAARLPAWWSWGKWALPAAAIVAALGWLMIAQRPWPIAALQTRGFDEYKLPGNTAFPVALAAAPDRSGVWFTLESSSLLGVLRDGEFAFVRKPSESIEPLGLAVDAAGQAWFTEAPKQAIVRAALDGTIASFPLGTSVSRLGRLAVAPDQSVWFAEPTHGSITQLKDGRLTRHPVSGASNAGRANDALPFGVAVAPDGTVWATLQNADALMRIAPNGDTAVVDVPVRQAGLSDIAIAADGAVWLLAAGANKIVRYAGGRFDEFSVPTPNAGLTALAVAPDGAAWFAALRAHRIGRVQQGVVTEFALPRENARPIAIAVDADNNVWYADLAGWIGRLAADRARAR